MSSDATLDFSHRARRALADPQLREAMSNIQTHLVEGRRRALAELPQFEQLRDTASAIKEHTLANLDVYLEQFEQRCLALGTQVHWAHDGQEAGDIIRQLCQSVNARLVIKAKSMVSEEVHLNAQLEEAGLTVVETDLGEYIIQLRADTPSHIVAPAVHLKAQHFEQSFRAAHQGRDPQRELHEPQSLLAEARAVLREKFLSADVAITGANFLVAESGSAVIVTNEGNADLAMTLAPVHIVLASIEKMVPTLEDALTLTRVLARSATGQAASSYTTLATGAARAGDADGPAQCHIVLLDNGRTRVLAGEERAMLKCIRCGACMNHCPVYGAVGGHAYGWVYPGPMGAVLTPVLTDLARSRELPNASSFCGRCDSVCPVKIPLTTLMRNLREQQAQRGLMSRSAAWSLALWGFIALRPALYRWATSCLIRVLRLFSSRGRAHYLPLAGAWTRYRDFPAPAARSFVRQWQDRQS